MQRRIRLFPILSLLFLFIALPIAIYLANNLKNTTFFSRAYNPDYPPRNSRELSGYSSLINIDRLPYLRPDMSAGQISSYDRDGGNDDGNINSRDSKLYTRNKNGETEYVIFEKSGCGYIGRIFMTGRKALFDRTKLRFYFGNSSIPKYEMTISEFFSGNYKKFISPMVGGPSESSGGYYSYVPIEYTNGLLIATNHEILYYDVNFLAINDSCFNEDANFDDSGDSKSIKKILNYEYWDKNGIIHPNNSHVQHDMALKNLPGSGLIFDTKTLNGGNQEYPMAYIAIDSGKSGTITATKFRIENISPDYANRFWLRIYWDGQTSPMVDVPIGHLFLVNKGIPPDNQVKSLFIQSSYNPSPEYLDFQLLLPMPFSSSAKIVIYDKRPIGATPIQVITRIDYNVHNNPLIMGQQVGYFKAVFNSQDVSNYPQDHILLDIAGKGVYIGTIATFHGTGTSRSYLEGDERIYIDNNPSPQIHGTGTEDYFNGGYYFDPSFPLCPVFETCYSQHDPDDRPAINDCVNDLFNQGLTCGGPLSPFEKPMHGAPMIVNSGGFNSTTMYRFHLIDPIPFNSHLKVAFEHGPANNAGTIYNSIALLYYY